MRPSQAVTDLEVLADSLPGPLYRKGIELTLNDNQTVREVYQQWLLLLTDLDYLHHGTFLRQARRLLVDMLAKDVLGLNNAFAKLLESVRTQEFKGFKALCSEVSSHLFPLVKDDMERSEMNDVVSAKRLIQLFSFTSRLTLHDIDLTQQCLNDYMEIEDSMSFDPGSPFLTSLNTTIKRWMKPFDPTRIVCKHGPGGVAGHGRTSLEFKYKDLTSDQLLGYAFGDPVWASGPISSHLERTSETIFVPKSYKTFRTISMEPSTLMYFQQGVWGEIDRVVSASRSLSERIGFHDQERNQRLAREGSMSRSYATIDLSAASDLVSYGLVKRLFRGTKLLRYIVACRSRRTLLPDGRLIELKKFAPMGSALCFPIETIVFAAICHHVTREHGVPEDYSVFGDDIIVPTQCAGRLMEVLESLGFRVNRDKSFFRSDVWFRESCGAEYCSGYDVTPMRVSRKYNHRLDDVQVTGLIDLANESYRKGFPFLRGFYLRKLLKSPYKPLFGPTAALSGASTNFHLERRWNPGLQRDELRASNFALKSPVRQDESIRYRHWLESTQDRPKVEFAFTSRIDRPTVLLQDHWFGIYWNELDHSFE